MNAIMCKNPVGRVLLLQLICLMSPLGCVLDTEPDGSSVTRAAVAAAGRSASPGDVVVEPPRGGSASPSTAVGSAARNTAAGSGASANEPSGGAGGAGKPSVVAAGSGAGSGGHAGGSPASDAGASGQAGSPALPRDASDALEQLAILLSNRAAADATLRLVTLLEWLSATAACEATPRRECDAVCNLVGPDCAICAGNHECAQAIARMCGSSANCG